MNEQLKSYSDQVIKAFQMYWEQFLFSLPRILLALIIVLVVFFVASRVQVLLNRRLSGKAHDPLFARFISQLGKVGLITGGLILAMQTLGLSGIAGGLLAGAGISAFIFGFAFKDIAENFLAGIILAFNRPFSLNDTIKIDDHIGHIMALNFRTTHIKTFDEKDVFIPNAIVIKQTVINLTRDGLIRLDFVVGIAYEDDILLAEQACLQELETVEGLLKDKPPFIVLEELATSTVNLRIFFWTTTDDYKKGVLVTKSNAMRKVKEGLLKKGFTLPADIREIKLYDKKDSFPVQIVGEKDQ